MTSVIRLRATATGTHRVARRWSSRAGAKKRQRDADAYHAAKRLEADGAFHAATNQAKALAVTLASEAAGLNQRRLAMAGEGGENLVGMEYARRLESVRFSGTPIARDPRVQQLSRSQVVDGQEDASAPIGDRQA